MLQTERTGGYGGIQGRFIFCVNCSRYFIIWYQTLGEAAPKEVDAVFGTLVPGFPSPHAGLGLMPPSPLPTAKNVIQATIFHDNSSKYSFLITRTQS